MIGYGMDALVEYVMRLMLVTDAIALARIVILSHWC